MAKKTDSYNSGYANARKLAADCGAEPEHHAYGGKMGKMPMRSPRPMMPMALAPKMGMPAAPAGGGMPGPGMPVRPPGLGLGAPPGGGGMPMLKHGGKAKKYAKGGNVAAKDVHKHEKHLHKGKPMTKLAAGGVAKQRLGAADASGKPTVPHIPSPKVKSKGKNAIKGG